MLSESFISNWVLNKSAENEVVESLTFDVLKVFQNV